MASASGVIELCKITMYHTIICLDIFHAHHVVNSGRLRGGFESYLKQYEGKSRKVANV